MVDYDNYSVDKGELKMKMHIMRYLMDGRIKPHYTVTKVIYDDELVGYRLYKDGLFSRYCWL